MSSYDDMNNNTINIIKIYKINFQFHHELNNKFYYSPY